MISPELHWYYDLETNVGQTIASGFFDSMSLYQKLSFDQQQQLEQVLYFFDLKADKNKKLKTLPLGKQRLALLAQHGQHGLHQLRSGVGHGDLQIG